MTDLLTRPAPGGVRRDEHRSIVLAAAGSAAWAAVLGLTAVTVVVVLAWAPSSSTAHAPAALRVAGALWLLAHHAGVRVDGGALGLVPLGLTVLPAALLYRAGRSLGRHLDVRSPRAAWTAASGLGASYGLLCGAVAVAVRAPGVRPEVVQALLGGWVLALACGGGGVFRQAGLGARLARRLPGWAPGVAAAAGLAAAGVIAAAALLTAATLATHHARAAALDAALGPGLVGSFALFALQAALLPDAVAWAVSYLVGPGFSIGAGTAYAAAGYAGGPVPALPLLAGLPAGPAPGWARVALLAVPVLAGAAAGWAVHRRCPPPAGAGGVPAWRAPALGLGAGVAAAAVLALAVLVAGGPAGPGAMATVGASAWRVALLAAAEIGGAAALVAAAARYAADRRS